ncbi:MAG: hypothetical protein KGI33_08045 [Thaumarchaeota archaeon]|nr:hypothetical protein [Nitrososphaerota archaeon]
MKVKPLQVPLGLTAIIICCMIVNSPHVATGLPAELVARIGGNATGVYFPLYNLEELPQVLAAKKEFPSVPFDVNINPASGPGDAPMADWTSAIVKLRNAGAVVTAYVPTGYGTERNVTDVEGMILSYSKFYPKMLDGIMFDEVSGSCSKFSFYKTLADYARSVGYSYLRANVGGPLCQDEITLFNQVAIYEGSGYPSQTLLESRTLHSRYPKDVVGFSATIHTAPLYDSSWLSMAQKYLKWIYITDQAEPNPYAMPPSYLERYLADLSSSKINLQPAPEFGPYVTMVLLISITAIIVTTMKLARHA